MTTTEDDPGRSGRPRRSVVVLTIAVLLVGGGATWAARTVAETHRIWAMDPLARSLEVSRDRLHEEISAVRYAHPDSTGRAAVQELTDETDRTFRFVDVDDDGATTAEVLLTATSSTGIIWPYEETTSVCLAVTVTPGSFWGGRGTVTSEQIGCTTSTPSPHEVRPPAETLDRHSTSVHRPAPTPEPEEPKDYPICYSGSDCEDNGYGG